MAHFADGSGGTEGSAETNNPFKGEPQHPPCVLPADAVQFVVSGVRPEVAEESDLRRGIVEALRDKTLREHIVDLC